MTPLIEPERDILPMGGLILAAAAFDGTIIGCCNPFCIVAGVMEPLPRALVGVDNPMIEPPADPADKEW